MEFGKISDISNVNWKLPPDDPLTVQFLEKSKNSSVAFKATKVFMGAPAWGHADWKGKIYPEKVKSTEFLTHYSQSFSCIELNTSHYRIPSKEQTEKWIAQTPPDFLFCPKVFQSISHSESGLIDKTLLKEWYQFLENIKDRRGPSFIQFPPHFEYSRRAALFEFLKNWPDEFELTLEFRHPSWFKDGKILPALTQYLQGRNIGLVITDVAGRRDVLHTSISANFTLLRFIGNNLHPTDYSRAEAWVRRLQQWSELGLEKIFLMVHEPDDVSAPEMAQFFVDKLKSTKNLRHRDLKDYSKENPEPALLPGF